MFSLKPTAFLYVKLPVHFYQAKNLIFKKATQNKQNSGRHSYGIHIKKYTGYNQLVDLDK